MGALRSWLRTRLGRGDSSSVNLVAKVSPRQAVPARLGLDVTPRLRPWSVARLAAIFREAQRLPTAESQREARHARHCLSSFWLTVPVDQLEQLYAGAIGDLQRQLLEGPLPAEPLAADEQQWCEQLATHLQQPGQLAERPPEWVNVLLALMPYLSAHGFSVAVPAEQLPQWLLADYGQFVDPSLRRQLQGPVGYLAPTPTPAAVEPPVSTADLAAAPVRPAPVQPAPAAATAGLPVLAQRRGEEALAWFRNEKAVNRMAALINLYQLEPEDSETLAELAGLRQVIAQLWLDVEPGGLEKLYRTAVGTVTRSLWVSGFGREQVDDTDAAARRALAPRVADLSRPGAINCLLAALLFYPPGKVRFEGGQQWLPAWLQQELEGLGS